MHSVCPIVHQLEKPREPLCKNRAFVPTVLADLSLTEQSFLSEQSFSIKECGNARVVFFAFFVCKVSYVKIDFVR